MRLLRLEIEDFALIERAVLEFSDGFTVCTGETGSGKTMLLGALDFVLGERASSEVLRDGAPRTRVTLEIEAGAALRDHLRASGLDDGGDDAEPVVVVREMASGGKSNARVNGRIATSAQLRDLGRRVLETVGQHAAQRLLAHSYQQEILDAFAGDEAAAARALTLAAFEAVRAADQAMSAFAESAGRAAAEIEFARFALGEIETVAPEDGEDERLRERRDYLANVALIASALGAAQAALALGDAAAIETLGAASASLGTVARYGPRIERLAESAGALQSDATELAVAISRELERAEFDPAELESVTGRLDALERLKKKYGGTLAAVRDARLRYAGALSDESQRDEREAELAATLARTRLALEQAARTLGTVRRSAAHELERRLGTELDALAMPAARFTVTLVPLAAIGPIGAESVTFELSANPGEPVRPLGRAASGGELSRVLLALVVAVAERRDDSALVFDEIDAGIGGATAAAVGVRLGTLARRYQVLCVTHLAQIASWADRHYALRKIERDGATVIALELLAHERASLEEIARMLSGSSAGVALEHARELVAAAGRR